MTDDERTAVPHQRRLAPDIAVARKIVGPLAKERPKLIPWIVSALTAKEAVALEEAAGVAENFDLGTPEGHKIAAAIRALPAARARSEESVKDEELGRNVRALLFGGGSVDIYHDGVAVYTLNVNHVAQPEFDTLDAAVAAARRGQ